MSAALGTVLICGFVLTYRGVDPLMAHLNGTPGYVTISSCRLLVNDPGIDGYECRGVFNGAQLRLENVRIDTRFSEAPVNPVATLATGPDAEVVHTPGWGLLVPFAAGIAMVGIGLFYLWRWSFPTSTARRPVTPRRHSSASNP